MSIAFDITGIVEVLMSGQPRTGDSSAVLRVDAPTPRALHRDLKPQNILVAAPKKFPESAAVDIIYPTRPPLYLRFWPL